MDKQNIDSLINWLDFYGQYIKTPITPAGANKMHASCPFGTHKDKNPSFWFTTDKGLFKCESCGVSGNATRFLSIVEGISTSEAYKKLCEIAGVSEDEKKKAGTYTLKEYALEKRLPLDYLASLGVRNGYNSRYVEMPYIDESGSVLSVRKRMPHNARQRFLWNKGAKLIPYGLWRLEDARTLGYVVLVEGESDAQTLWYLGIPALGMPGASSFNEDHAKLLLDIPLIYLHVENDRGGKTAKRRVAQSLLACGYTGVVKAWSCAKHNDHKDPSSLFCAEDQSAFTIIHGLLQDASVMILEQAAMGEMPGLEDAPIKLRVPNGYDLNAGGIYEANQKTGLLEDTPFCWTPLLITKILYAEDGTVKAEVAFRENGSWHFHTLPRDALLSSRTVVRLGAYSADVNSENAAAVVRWFSSLQCGNTSLIPRVKSVTRYGWIGDDFKAFMPGALGDYVFEPASFGRAANAGQCAGSLDEWLSAMKPHRQHPLFRFILAAAFATPLLKILVQRIFMIYNWGDSRGGKTAALIAALSVWGNPDDLRMSFNSTNVALERTVGFMTDLPFGINERQLAGSKQEHLEKIVYTLSEGQGRGRGMKEGGVQQQVLWRSIIIANGEEPLAADSSQTGVSSRAIELFGKPFESEEDAAAMYSITSDQHGYAGIAYIQKLITADHDAIRTCRKDFIQKLSSDTHSRNFVAAIATVCTADYLVEHWLYGVERAQAWETALWMGMKILGMLDGANTQNVNERAFDFITDWITSNRKQFTDDFTGAARFGMIETANQRAYIVSTVFNDALKSHGFAPGKVRRWLAEQGHIEVEVRSGEVRDTVQRRMLGISTRMVCFKIPQLIDQWSEDVDEDIPF